MSKRRTKRAAGATNRWHVPLSVSDVPEAGLHIDLTPDEREREAVATIALARAAKADSRHSISTAMLVPAGLGRRYCHFEGSILSS